MSTTVCEELGNLTSVAYACHQFVLGPGVCSGLLVRGCDANLMQLPMDGNFNWIWSLSLSKVASHRRCLPGQPDAVQHAIVQMVLAGSWLIAILATSALLWHAL